VHSCLPARGRQKAQDDLLWISDAMPRCSTCSAGSEVWTQEAAGVRHAALPVMLQRGQSAPAAGIRGRMLSSAAPAAGGGDGARRRRPARPPRGPSWRRGALSATPPTRAAPPGFLHGSGGTGRCLRCSTRVGLASCTLTCHSRHMLCPPWPRHIHVMRGAALATMADPGRDAAAAVGARALLIALACPWRQLPTAGPRLRRPLGGAHGAGACDLLHGRACRLL